ncbi:hypothetical protein [Bradyrhizobium sp.]|uniref:hypothetical protein n=1 Tax=Bradyrhizobium sp. TaxID=376 RepID=UPI0025C622D4|nr:hypothetical protein [Bradyrhizobium sp.]
MPRMKAAIFVEPGRIVLDDKPIPDVDPLEPALATTASSPRCAREARSGCGG